MIDMWTKNIFTSVYSRVSANGRIRLISKYPKINFTNSTPKSNITSFPTVIMTEMQGSETARDIEGSFVNGMISNIQIEVITNTSQEDANYVADVCLDLMKSLKYAMVGSPYPNSTTDNQYRNIARYRREVDYGDVI